MILGLLAVEAPGNILIVHFRQLHGGGRGDGDPLVGRSEQHVIGDAGIHQGGGIEAAQLGQITAGVEQTGIEEIGALATRFQGEFAKLQYLLAQGKLDKLALVGFHAWSSWSFIFYGVHPKNAASAALVHQLQ